MGAGPTGLALAAQPVAFASTTATPTPREGNLSLGDPVVSNDPRSGDKESQAAEAFLLEASLHALVRERYDPIVGLQ